MALPLIKTAIPKRRYQFGEFDLVVLGEIESDDGISYHFLLGIIPAGASAPELFISAEPVGQQPGEPYQMRIIAEQVNQILDQRSDRWRDLDAFVTDALALASQLLNLADEEPRRLL